MAAIPDNFNARLIELVRAYPNLYNLSDGNYYNKQFKEACWEEVAKELKWSGKVIFFFI